MINKQSLATPALVLGFAAIITVTGCRSSVHETKARAATIPTARVAIVQVGDISQILTLAGQFQPYQVVDVHPKVSGYMSHINVDIGDIVHKGQVLAVLDVPELKAQLQQTQFQLQQSKQEINRARREISRAEANHAALHAAYQRLKEAAATRPGLIAQQELDDAAAKDLSSEAQVDAAKDAMAAASEHSGAALADNQRVEALHNYTNVTSPLDGVVIWRYADSGALIQGGTNSNSQDLPIVRLSQSNLLRLRIPVPENDVRYVHEGDQLQVRVDAINRSFTGKIARFTRDVNFETRTMETEIDVNNGDLSISPGMYANTALQLAHVKHVITIPVEAVILRGDKRVVYVLDASNHVHVRSVDVGMEGSKLAEIKNGLASGDRILIGGQDSYSENEEVRPLVDATQASETVQQTGGMIDLKADAAGDNQ